MKWKNNTKFRKLENKNKKLEILLKKNGAGKNTSCSNLKKSKVFKKIWKTKKKLKWTKKAKLNKNAVENNLKIKKLLDVKKYIKNKFKYYDP